jgi:hypothetical protein
MDSFESDRPDLVQAGWPPALIKAALDPFDYVLRLRTGEVIHFQQAIPSSTFQWAHLVNPELLEEPWQAHFTGGGLGAMADLLDQLTAEPEAHHPIHAPAPAPSWPCSRGLDVRISDVVWIADRPWR